MKVERLNILKRNPFGTNLPHSNNTLPRVEFTQNDQFERRLRAQLGRCLRNGDGFHDLPWIWKLQRAILSSKNTREAQVTFNPAFSRSLPGKNV